MHLVTPRLSLAGLSARMPPMFGLAYVILPFSDQPPGKAITRSLARFERGRRGQLPDEWLSFHDDTADLRQVYEATYTFTLARGLRISGGDSWYLSTGAVIQAMEERGRTQWTVCFADIEPDFEVFVERFVVFKCDRHPVSHSFGRWLNPLGRWDWWDLGGCFNGTITGRRRKASDRNSAVSSGNCDGRQAFEMMADLLCQPEEEPASPIDIATNENIELVTTLGEAITKRCRLAIPGALVLPPHSVADSERWLDAWPDLLALAAPEDEKRSHRSSWEDKLRSQYAQFSDHWAAAVAYHF
jgi:hypothetical protein